MNNIIDSSEEHFYKYLEASAVPDWIRGLKVQYWERQQAIPEPSSKDPFWRFSNPSHFNLSELGRDSSNAVAVDFSKAMAGRIVLSNDDVVDWQPISDELKQKGVVWAPLRQAFFDHQDILDRYFLHNIETLGSDKWAYLNAAYCENGVLLYVPENVEISMPFLVQFLASKDICFPQILVVLEKDAKATLYDTYSVSNSQLCLSSQVVLHQGANLHRKAIQNANKEASLLRMESQSLHEGSFYQNFFMELGGGYSRSEVKTLLQGTNATTETYGITVGDDSQFFDQRFEVLHEKPSTKSQLIFKSISNDRSKTVSHCRIKVPQGSQQVHARQRNSNLILSNDAVVHNLPELEIEANDVQCSHGASTSHLDDDQLFYLASRGIDPSVAQDLLTQGFCEDILQQVCDQEEIDFFQKLLYNKFST